MERFSHRNPKGIRPVRWLIGAVCIGLTSCTPKLAPVTTTGLLTRSFDNYSQSTVVRSERLMTETRSEAPTPSRIPKQEYTRGPRSNSEGTVARSQAEVIAPRNYVTQSIPSAAPSVPVPKQTRSQARQQARLRAQEQRAAAERENEPVRPVRGGLGIPKATEASAAQMKNISFVTRRAASPEPTPQPAPKQEETAPQPVPEAAAPQQVQASVQTATTPQASVRPPRQQQVSGAVTQVSEVTPMMTAKEQRALDKRRKAEARRLLAERQAQAKAAEAAKAEQQRTMAAATTRRAQSAETETESENTYPEEPATQENSTESQPEQALQGVPAQGETQNSDDSELSALARALTMPDATVRDKPTPAFINTPKEENTVVDEAEAAAAKEGTVTAIAPPVHQFQPNETEHVKFSYYDPFGKGNNRFVVVLNEQRFCYPYPGRFLSGYGPRGRGVHTGVDIKGVKNDTVRAAFAGTVRMSKLYSGYGNCVVIRHKNGLETLYAHNTRNLVQVGDVVRAGDPIGLIGRTGRATTEHCHFEVRIQGQHINPALVIDYHNHRLQDGVLSVTKQANGRIVAQNRASGLAPSQATDREDTGSGDSAGASGGSKTSSTTSTTTTYTVRSGDTLWGIARRFGTTVANLCALNNLNREATLPLGKRLKIR
nr:peptidoglycan DD-metalloendopeptidase family protein [uncultured Rikenella sp.]